MKNPGTFKVGNKVALLPVTRKVAVIGNITILGASAVTVMMTGTTQTFTCPWALITSMAVHA